MLKPLADRVVVRPVVRELSSVLHVQNNEPFNRGKIVAVGPKVRSAQEGEFILYGNGDYLKWPTHKIDGQDYQIIQEADICAVVDEE